MSFSFQVSRPIDCESGGYLRARGGLLRLRRSAALIVLFWASFAQETHAEWELAAPSGPVIESREGTATLRLLSSRNHRNVNFACWIESGGIAAKIAAGTLAAPSQDDASLAIPLSFPTLKVPVRGVLRLESEEEKVNWRFWVLPEGWAERTLFEITSGKVHFLEGTESSGWSNFLEKRGVTVEPIAEAGVTELPASTWLIVPTGWKPSGTSPAHLRMLCESPRPEELPPVVEKEGSNVTLSISARRLKEAETRPDIVWEILLALQTFTSNHPTTESP